MIQENSGKKTVNNGLNYMLFAFGALLIIVGLYLRIKLFIVYPLKIREQSGVTPECTIGLVV